MSLSCGRRFRGGTHKGIGTDLRATQHEEQHQRPHGRARVMVPQTWTGVRREGADSSAAAAGAHISPAHKVRASRQVISRFM